MRNQNAQPPTECSETHNDGVVANVATRAIATPTVLEEGSYNMAGKQGSAAGTLDLRLRILVLLVSSIGAMACSEGPAAVGSASELAVRAGRTPCSLDDADRVAPTTVELWAPNHKFHLLSIEQCVPALLACDRGLAAEFTWASSDEPIDSSGDGHHQPDIVRVDRDHVCVRAERQGPSNGRSYHLGVTIGDREAQCEVVVNHDKRGTLAVDDGERYRVVFDDADDRGSCDGEPVAPPGGDEPAEPPRPPRPPTPPADPPKAGAPGSDQPAGLDPL